MSRRGLYIGPPLRFLALDEAHDRNHLKAKVAGGLNGLDGGSAGSANVIDDDNTRAFSAKAFDALTGSMLFFALANQKAVHFSAHDCDRHNNRISAHGEASDGLGAKPTLPDLIPENLPCQTRSPGVKR